MKVLAVGCHPDDLEIACSGTLRKYVEQGAEVYMCHVANGCLGHVIIEPEELRVIRCRMKLTVQLQKAVICSS